MADIKKKGRLALKHDTEANWNKAKNFIPMKGEPIVYDPDESVSYSRIKIGDGVRTVIALPFASGQSDMDQSNPEDASYIRNRTHYREIGYYEELRYMSTLADIGNILSEDFPMVPFNQVFELDPEGTYSGYIQFFDSEGKLVLIDEDEGFSIDLEVTNLSEMTGVEGYEDVTVLIYDGGTPIFVNGVEFVDGFKEDTMPSHSDTNSYIIAACYFSEGIYDTKLTITGPGFQYEDYIYHKLDGNYIDEDAIANSKSYVVYDGTMGVEYSDTFTPVNSDDLTTVIEWPDWVKNEQDGYVYKLTHYIDLPGDIAELRDGADNWMKVKLPSTRGSNYWEYTIGCKINEDGSVNYRHLNGFYDGGFAVGGIIPGVGNLKLGYRHLDLDCSGTLGVGASNLNPSTFLSVLASNTAFDVYDNEWDDKDILVKNCRCHISNKEDGGAEWESTLGSLAFLGVTVGGENVVVHSCKYQCKVSIDFYDDRITTSYSYTLIPTQYTNNKSPNTTYPTIVQGNSFTELIPHNSDKVASIIDSTRYLTMMLVPLTCDHKIIATWRK